MMDEVHMTCSSRVATDLQEQCTTASSLERAAPVSVRNGEMRRPNEYNTLGTSTEDLSILQS